MNLTDCRFYHGGGINFVVFSDNFCKVRHLSTIQLPIARSTVEEYAIEPGTGSRWVAVHQSDGDRDDLHLFIGMKGRFAETSLERIPKSLRKEIKEKVTERIRHRKSSFRKKTGRTT